MDFKTAGRADDFISLLQMMVFMFNGGQLPGMDLAAELSIKESFLQALKAKSSYTPESLCVGRAKCLKTFASQVFSLQFKEKPDYAGL